MQGRKAGCYPMGICDRVDSPGSGSRLFYINTWAMIWPTDYRDCDYHLEPRADTAQELEQITDSGPDQGAPAAGAACGRPSWTPRIGESPRRASGPAPLPARGVGVRS